MKRFNLFNVVSTSFMTLSLAMLTLATPPVSAQNTGASDSSTSSPSTGSSGSTSGSGTGSGGSTGGGTAK